MQYNRHLQSSFSTCLTVRSYSNSILNDIVHAQKVPQTRPTTNNVYLSLMFNGYSARKYSTDADSGLAAFHSELQLMKEQLTEKKNNEAKQRKTVAYTQRISKF